jgi:hypothetical protein
MKDWIKKYILGYWECHGCEMLHSPFVTKYFHISNNWELTGWYCDGWKGHSSLQGTWTN